MTIEERITERKKIRAIIAGAEQNKNPAESILLLISESLDDYIVHRIETDKTLEGILKDIQGNTSIMAEYHMNIKKILTENVN